MMVAPSELTKLPREAPAVVVEVVDSVAAVVAEGLFHFFTYEN